MKRSLLATTLCALPLISNGAHAISPNPEVERLQEQVDTLAEKLDAVTEVMEKSPSTQPRPTTIGGYGEIHYNNLTNESAGSDKKELDLHRFVLMFGHQFSDSMRMFSELEVEHAVAGEGQEGEVELEQAYVEFDLSERTRARGGLFLMPVGILNETHEPPTFYGVERNPVEKNIIPTTWWEGGALLNGHLGQGVGYDLALTSGLYSTDYAIRGGRQKGAKAKADNLAYTGRIKWTAIPGLELAASVNHQTDLAQDTGSEAVSATLVETHIIYQQGGFGLRALYAGWELDDDGTATGRDEQHGWYVEPSYRLSEQLGLFARYNNWDNAAGSGADSEFTQTDFGLNYWPHNDVVLKLDYQDQSAPDGEKEYDGINLGLGFQF